MVDIEYEENELRIDQNVIRLSERIQNVVTKNDIILVQFENGQMDSRNVVAFDTQGTKLWRIQPLEKGQGGATPVMDLSIAEDFVQVRDISMDRYKLDIDTGNVEFLGWSR